jgi:hypothetical protein
MNALINIQPISFDTPEVRRAYLRSDDAVPVTNDFAARLLEVEPSAIAAAYVSFADDLRFLVVKGLPYVTAAYVFLPDGEVERLSEPCLDCSETGRVEQERAGGQDTRWVPCSCPSGCGEVGRWF